MATDGFGPAAESPGRVELIVHAALDRLAGDCPALGIALSGGGDSTALLHLAQGWARGRRLMAATVDHGLRAGSDDEARQAGRVAAKLGIAHQTLIWTRTGGGNLMAAARDARLHLLAGWAAQHGLSAVLLGHTLDDQAETLLMRLNRGAGVDGLAGMAPARHAHGIDWLRPMLGVSRADLRQWLVARGIGWVDDPSNQNPDFERVRTRKALEVSGLSMPQLVQSAANLAMARDALEEFAAIVAQGAMARVGALTLPLGAFRRAPAEIRRRLLVAGLRFVSGADYPPRREAVLHAMAVIGNGARLTLDGVLVEPRGDRLHLIREPAAAARSAAACGQGGAVIWDRRWEINGMAPGHQVRALGYDLLPGLDWRASGLMRDEAAAAPGIWAGSDLVAAPLLQASGDVTARPLRGLREFHTLLYTH